MLQNKTDQTEERELWRREINWDSFPSSCMYMAFTLIGFVTMKPRASFLRTPLCHVSTVGGKEFGRCWFSLKLWLLAVMVAQQAPAHVRSVWNKCMLVSPSLETQLEESNKGTCEVELFETEHSLKLQWIQQKKVFYFSWFLTFTKETCNITALSHT